MVLNLQRKETFFNVSEDEILKFGSQLFISYQLQRAGQGLIKKFFPDYINKNYVKCHRIPIGEIEILRSLKSGKAYYHGCISCANPFLCPVCSPRIMGKRAGEIKEAVHKWLHLSLENTCYMLTLTFQHNRKQELSFLLPAFKSALQTFWRDFSVKNIFSGIQGRITATEINFGIDAGWHPHQHILLFCKISSFDKERLFVRWKAALKASGLSGLKGIALDLIEARSCDKYLSKISSEMVFSNLKEGRGKGHFSPFQLLDHFSEGNIWAGKRFADLFEESKHFHPLRWSPGLKRFFCISQVSDSEIMDFVESDYLTWETFHGDVFPFLKVQERALLLVYATKNDKRSFNTLLDSVYRRLEKQIIKV